MRALTDVLIVMILALLDLDLRLPAVLSNGYVYSLDLSAASAEMSAT